MHWIDPHISFFLPVSQSVCVSVNRSVVERLRLQFIIIIILFVLNQTAQRMTAMQMNRTNKAQRTLIVALNGPFVYGGTNCTRGWIFADIFFSDSVKIMLFYDFARTYVS